MKLCQKLICFLVFIFLACATNAQSSISLSTGISTDINNSNISFYQVPISLLWKPVGEEFSPLLLLGYNFPLSGTSTGDAYTLNPALPAKVRLSEKISPYLFTVAIGFAVRLSKSKNNNSLYVNLLPFGICNQNIKVTYKNYDKENYEVLNPDVNRNEAAFVMAASVAYYFHKTKKDLMVMLQAQSGMMKKKDAYPLSYNSIAPLQLTIGYNFYYPKK
jgi:hypothetical protein